MSDAPNVILVTFDSLSAGDMSLYGYRRPTTPFIDCF
ncbi:MAG: sulfatase-like hydrolase/transferase, partial [Thermoleophilia bacterium]|nr:sulfatase-like hydrolase/transferase [Thermoleophilia bacterium]